MMLLWLYQIEDNRLLIQRNNEDHAVSCFYCPQYVPRIKKHRLWFLHSSVYMRIYRTFRGAT